MISARQQQIETYINIYKSLHNVKPKLVNFNELSDEEIDVMLEQISLENEIYWAGYSSNDLELAYDMGAVDEEQAILWAKDMNN